MAPPHHHLLTSLSHLQHLCSSPVLSISYKIAKNKELLFPEDIFKALYGSACHTDDWLYHERIYFKRSVNMRLKSYVLNMIFAFAKNLTCCCHQWSEGISAKLISSLPLIILTGRIAASETGYINQFSQQQATVRWRCRPIKFSEQHLTSFSVFEILKTPDRSWDIRNAIFHIIYTIHYSEAFIQCMYAGYRPLVMQLIHCIFNPHDMLWKVP